MQPTCLAGDGPLETCQFLKLILLTPLLFTETLTREGLLGAALFTRFHVITVLLDFLDDVFGLNFPLKTPKGVFQGFSLLNNNFCHAYSPPFPFSNLIWPIGFASWAGNDRPLGTSSIRATQACQVLNEFAGPA